ncbi:DDB1- and CUL4-associated factor 11 isoform X2 [Lingula anatina]|uniref:DDB1- and CUL4-associated factor 11 isoform X2 n=1 Tax=Lingula anatina TaxID=7574 RepID=A0A1S3JK10_LINAN|nr:DDB1- and CUL4-associated factor 11 isoform X2 [Lingula anatina]|eukprot:XP_013410755.1 DDB1- and CUL4-associated factor 11 isoform X2 [Lingula anatina]
MGSQNSSGRRRMSDRNAGQRSAEENPDTNTIDRSEFRQEVLLQSEGCLNYNGALSKPSIVNMVQRREIGLMNGSKSFTRADCCVAMSKYLPNHKDTVAQFHSKVFCGTYSQDGDIFLSACQDQNIRIFDTSWGKFTLMKSVRARDVGWSVVDTAFSPDGNYLIYSSWSDCIHLCNIHGEHEVHEALHLFPDAGHSFCAFSIVFSADNKEILAGSNDGGLYVYDRESNQRCLKITAHEDDVNSVAFADTSSHILFSGGDDGLVKVWDRRTLSEATPVPVGTLAGHSDGITFIDSKNDSRYLLSNSKDQSIKLWDMRKFSSDDAIRGTKRAVARQNWDYRWPPVPARVKKVKHVEGDSSLMTYRGHSVLHSLIRARFSPAYTTGQRYIYTGCASGGVVVYDVLTGKVVSRLDGHRGCVRDVSWHPYEHTIISTSWDGSLGKWTYNGMKNMPHDIDSDSDENASDDDDERCPRRSKRLASLTRRLDRRRLPVHGI